MKQIEEKNREIQSLSWYNNGPSIYYVRNEREGVIWLRRTGANGEGEESRQNYIDI